MAEELQFDPLAIADAFEAQAASMAFDGAATVPSPDLERLGGVSVELTVEVGRTRMTLSETLALGPGSVVTLDRLADQPVDLLVNGRPIARGEVVVIDEEFGLRITEVVGVEPGATGSGGSSGDAPPGLSAVA